MSNQNGTQAVDRAARLLSEVVHATDPMTFTGLSAATGLAKSTTSRLLLALERNGLVRRDDHGRFLPGEMFVSFAWRGGAEAGLVAVAQPFLERLGKATGETVNLGVVSGGVVEQIAQVDSTYFIAGSADRPRNAGFVASSVCWTAAREHCSPQSMQRTRPILP